MAKKIYSGSSKKLNNKSGGSAGRNESLDYEHRKQAYGEPTVKGRKTPVPEVQDGQALTDGSPQDGWI